MQNDNFTLPPEAAETPALWKKLVGQLLAEKWDDAESTLKKMGLSPKLTRLFGAALQEEKELSEIIAAGEGQEEKHRQLCETLKDLNNYQATNLEEVGKISSKKAELKKQCETAFVAISHAKAAEPKRRFLRTWLAELFGEVPADPKHGGILSSFTPPAKTYGEIAKLAVNPHILSSWRFVDKEISEFPRLRYQSLVTVQQTPRTAAEIQSIPPHRR